MPGRNSKEDDSWRKFINNLHKSGRFSDGTPGGISEGSSKVITRRVSERKPGKFFKGILHSKFLHIFSEIPAGNVLFHQEYLLKFIKRYLQKSPVEG